MVNSSWLTGTGTAD